MGREPEQTKDALHKPSRAQSWPDVDGDVRDWVHSIVDGLKGVLEDALVDVYLHGSLAIGCYYRPKSDVDLLVVVREHLSSDKRRETAEFLLNVYDARPSLGGLEISLVTTEEARHFQHPMRFEVHFSRMWAEPTRQGTVDYEADRRDPDLAAHVTVTRGRGVGLLGPQPRDVFSPVPFADYVAAIRDDLDWIVGDENILESPYYGVLNACRYLMVMKNGDGCVPTKDEAGEWARRELPKQYKPVIEQALACYRSAAPVDEAQRQRHGHDWDDDALKRFREYVRACMRTRRDNGSE